MRKTLLRRGEGVKGPLMRVFGPSEVEAVAQGTTGRNSIPGMDPPGPQWPVF